jgi:hypothetical protein
MLGVKGIKMTVYVTSSAKPSALTAANPFVPARILARALKFGSITALK